MSDEIYVGPTGELRDAQRERELIGMSLVDAWGFEYYAPHESKLEWWPIFWESIERSHHKCRVRGQCRLTDFVQEARA